MALLLLLRRRHQGVWIISLVPRTRRHLLHHPLPDSLAPFSHPSPQRELGRREGRTLEIKLVRIIRVKTKPAKLPICIKTKLPIHATSVHQSTMEAKKIIVQELGPLNPTSSILLRKMAVRTMQMGIMQTVLREETGGRVHFITNSASRGKTLISSMYGKTNKDGGVIYGTYIAWQIELAEQPGLIQKLSLLGSFYPS